MQKNLVVGLLMLTAWTLMTIAPAVADDVDVNAQLRSRSEYLDNFDDLTDNAGRSLDFTTYQVRLGLDFGFSETVDASLEVMHNGAWGDSNLGGTGDPTIDGTATFPGKDATLLYQAFVDWDEVGGTLLSLRVGRQEHIIGNELHLGDNDFYNGLSFDGVRAMLDFEMTDVDVFYYTIVERDVTGGTGGGATPGSNDTTMGGASARFDLAESQTIEPYLIYFRNGLASTDFYTAGALYGKARGDQNAFDWSAELALQSGDTTVCPAGGGAECDLSSYVAEGWFGWTFGSESSHHLQGRGLILGDSDDAEDNEAFTPLFTDTHGRAGALDLFSRTSTSAIGGAPFSGGTNTFHNLTVLDVGYDYTTGPHSVGVIAYKFRTTEDFGGDSDIGAEIDVIYDFKTTKHIDIQAGAAFFMPGDAFEAPPLTDDDALRVWAMLRVRK